MRLREPPVYSVYSREYHAHRWYVLALFLSKTHWKKQQICLNYQKWYVPAKSQNKHWRAELLNYINDSTFPVNTFSSILLAKGKSFKQRCWIFLQSTVREVADPINIGISGIIQRNVYIYISVFILQRIMRIYIRMIDTFEPSFWAKTLKK